MARINTRSAPLFPSSSIRCSIVYWALGRGNHYVLHPRQSDPSLLLASCYCSLYFLTCTDPPTHPHLLPTSTRRDLRDSRHFIWHAAPPSGNPRRPFLATETERKNKNNKNHFQVESPRRRRKRERTKFLFFFSLGRSVSITQGARP